MSIPRVSQTRKLISVLTQAPDFDELLDCPTPFYAYTKSWKLDIVAIPEISLFHYVYFKHEFRHPTLSLLLYHTNMESILIPLGPRLPKCCLHAHALSCFAIWWSVLSFFRTAATRPTSCLPRVREHYSTRFIDLSSLADDSWSRVCRAADTI